jgi:hypothetical protein
METKATTNSKIATPKTTRAAVSSSSFNLKTTIFVLDINTSKGFSVINI